MTQSTIRRKRVVGTAGHIDHGKTSLVRALTGVDTDRLPEEKRRGITIDLGFASWFTDEYQIGFIDVPGHERFVKNMLAGVGGIDSALLVVAADESIKPQTREHFAICRLLGIPTGLVAITKSDLVERDILELVRMEVEELVAGSFLEGKPIVPVSSTTGAGLDDLRAALLQSVASVDDRDATTRVFRLPIDRVFTMKGFGSVITGTTYSGHVKVEDEVEVLPGALRSRARAVQVHGEPREEAAAGERTSMNLADIPLEELRRGQQVLHPGTLRPSQIITARLELLEEGGRPVRPGADETSALQRPKPLKEQTRIRFHHLSAELLGTIRFVDNTDGELKPGQSAFVQIRLESPVVAVAGDRFVIRRYSPAYTIGGGAILDAHLSKLSRGTRTEILETLASGTLQERVELMAKLQGLRGLALDEVQARTGIRTATLTKELKKVPNVVAVGNTFLHHDVLADFRRRAMEFLERYFKDNKMAVSVPKGEFVQKLIPAGAPVNFLLSDLANQKIAVVHGDALDIPGRSKTLGGAEGELARNIESRFAAAGLQTPAVSEIIKAIPQRPKVIEGVIAYLVKQGALVRLAEGVYLHRDVIADARAKLAEKKGQTIDVGQFKDLFGISRKVAIPLLEYLDREGATKRVGDQRVVL
ncbi:MAG TPA: selenocysteine-specific translation elongation factor [Thermoanaerobaculia bacterium]|nr:selenocysteine-specific translation elongation factor [Thermoanaerobaculia bacterium]